MEFVPFEQTEITGGFWKQKQDMARNTTIRSIYDRFYETGRFEALKFNWKEGMPNKPHIFFDSDIAKWIESVAYITEKKREPELEKLVDDIVDQIVEKQEPCGYFNSYFQHMDPTMRFTNRDMHELYCAGHLIEAAVAYDRATGKDKLLKAMCRYADYIERRFKINRDTGFFTPGCEKIEYALIQLYRHIGEKRYLDLAEYFVDERGTRKESVPAWMDQSCVTYNQSDRPVREFNEAVGHAVRAVYLYSAMADLAMINNDKSLADACRRVFDDMYYKKMYVTGGIGSTAAGEAFTLEYDMPNIFAYTETCASYGLAIFAHQMLLIENKRKYADTVEKELYNGFLSGVSLDGSAFFYENPLEVIPRLCTRDRYNGGLHFPLTRRQKVFGCSCCPPNITRLIPIVGSLLYTKSDADNLIYVQQFMQSETEMEVRGKKVKLSQKTDYPANGRVEITYHGEPARLAVRVPGWCDNYNGETVDGYAYFDVSDGKTVTVDFDMTPYAVEANPKVEADCNRFALIRGPVVYCMEGVDNGDSLRDIIVDTSETSEEFDSELGVIAVIANGKRRLPFDDGEPYRRARDKYEDVKVKFIPYYAFANRDECEMLVWFSKK